LSHPRKALGVAVATALVALAPGIPAASAAMTHSSASADKAFGFYDMGTLYLAARHITATSDGNSGDPVDIACMQGATRYSVIESTSLGANGSLDHNVAESLLPARLCRIAVVNPGDTTAAAAAFSGPTIGGGVFDPRTSDGHLYDFKVAHAYRAAYTVFWSLGDCGLCDMALLNADGQLGGFLFSNNAALYGTHPEPGGGSRPELVVDGKRAYAAFEASTSRPGHLPLTVTHAQDPVTGDMAFTEEQDFVACVPDDTTCTSYVQTPIHWKRVAAQDHGGRVVRFTDTLTNTDTSNSHDYDLDFDQYQMATTHNGFRFPGESGYATHLANDIVSSGFGPVSTIGFVRDTTLSTGVANPLGTLTVSPQPVRAWFRVPAGFNLQFKGTIPAGGNQTIRQTFSMGESQAEVDGYAAQAEVAQDAESPPSVAITAPAEGTTVSATPVTVTGTASDNKGVASLKVNGADVSLAGDGTWSTSLKLTEGANAITASARDAAGNEATATRSISYAKPATPPATVSKNGKVKVTRKGSKVTLDTGIKVTCPAGGSACTAAVDAKTIKAVASKLKKSKVTLAKKTFTIATGKSKKIVLTLGAKGAKALKRNKKLTVKVTVVTKVGNGTAKATTRTITIKYPKARKKA
jgi:hypothetical protein